VRPHSIGWGRATISLSKLSDRAVAFLTLSSSVLSDIGGVSLRLRIARATKPRAAPTSGDDLHAARRSPVGSMAHRRAAGRSAGGSRGRPLLRRPPDQHSAVATIRTESSPDIRSVMTVSRSVVSASASRETAVAAEIVLHQIDRLIVAGGHIKGVQLRPGLLKLQPTEALEIVGQGRNCESAGLNLYRSAALVASGRFPTAKQARSLSNSTAPALPKAGAVAAVPTLACKSAYQELDS